MYQCRMVQLAGLTMVLLPLVASTSCPSAGVEGQATLTDDATSLLQTGIHYDLDRPIKINMKEVDDIKLSFVSFASFLENPAFEPYTPTHTKKCFDGQAWLDMFAKQKSWNKHSQGDQDAVLASLFSDEYLGTTSKKFVEFGFPDHDFSTSYGNSRNLKESMGFSESLLLDGRSSNPDINLHTSFITADNIVDTFDQYNVPHEVDYMSVDIDSCDLWVFHAITKKYQPRVMTVEYNSNYPLGDYTTLKCASPKVPGAYVWKGDNIYGTSLSAIELAAKDRGYSLVYVTPRLDAFLVRNDLLCPGTVVPKETFRAATGLPMHSEYIDRGYGPKSDLVTDFKEWLTAHPSS